MIGRDRFLISQGLEERDESGLVRRIQVEAVLRMLREVRIERGTAVDAGAVVFDHFLEGREPAVVHVGTGEGHIAQTRCGEFSVIAREIGDLETPAVRAVEAVVMKLVIAEQRPPMAVETIRAILAGAGLVFRHEQLKAALLGIVENRLPAQCAVEPRIGGR